MQCVLVHALEKERTQIQLAALADLDKTTMVATVDELERAGLARRVPVAARSPGPDHRGHRGRAPRGRRRGQRIVDRVHADALGALSEPDQTAFVDALRTLPKLARPPATPAPHRRTPPATSGELGDYQMICS